MELEKCAAQKEFSLPTIKFLSYFRIVRVLYFYFSFHFASRFSGIAGKATTKAQRLDYKSIKFLHSLRLPKTLPCRKFLTQCTFRGEQNIEIVVKNFFGN
jgi:hypothetical protein